MLKKRYLTGKVLAGITLGMCCAGLSAQQFERDIQLAKELNDINLQDYAQNLIDGLLKENQNNQELLAQKAENFVAQGKMDEAMKIINGLDKNSPAYYNAQAGIGIFYVRQRKFAEGLPMLVTVKEYAIQNGYLNQYKTALAWLLTAYQDQGKAAEAQELLAILAKLEEGDTERSAREMKLAQARYGLSCIENMKTTSAERLKILKDEYNAKWKATAVDAAKKKTLDGLEGQRRNHWNNYSKSIMGGNANAAKTHGTNYYNVYKNIAKTIGMDEKAAVELASLEKVKALQPGRLKLILKGRASLSPQEVNVLAIKDNNDWQDVVYQAIVDMEEVQWGGLDSSFFMAAANLMQAYYHLGQHEKALTIYRKNKNLFVQCDAEYKKNGEAIENSPTADARMWEGYNCLSLAKQFEAKKNQKQALQYYKRAFVAFGQLLMNYPKHRDGAKNYPVLLEIVEKLKALDPRMSNALDTQLARVPKPELKASSSNAEVEIVELVPPLPAQQFKDGNALASDNMKKDRTANKSTDADWEKCREHFKVVDAELTPIMQGNRLSTGLPKVLNHLLIANGYLAAPNADGWNLFKFRSLVELGEFMYRDNDLVHHGIVVGANALWMYAERCEAAGKHDIALQLQNEAMDVYETFLRLAPSHPYAPNVAIRLASMDFVRANKLGEKINEMQKTGASLEEISKTKKEWIAGFDRALARFEFIFNNFSNRKEFIDKSYELAIESYRLTGRLIEAADMCDRFCASGSEDSLKILKAKMDAASNLYRHVQEKLLTRNKELDAEIKSIVEPEEPAELTPDTLALLEKEKNTQPGEKESQELTEAKALKVAYDKALEDYKRKVEDFKPQAEKREILKKELADNQKQVIEITNRAVKAIQELRNWTKPGSAFLSGIKNPDAATGKIKTECYRADTLLPWLYLEIANIYAGRIKQLEAEILAIESDKKLSEQEKKDITANLKSEITTQKVPLLENWNSAVRNYLVVAQKYEAQEQQKEARDKQNKNIIPSYLLQAAMLYLNIADMTEEKAKQTAVLAEAEKVSNELRSKYSDKPEGKNVQYYLARTLYKSGKYDQALKLFYEFWKEGNQELKDTLNVSKYREISTMMLECPDPAQRVNAADISQKATTELLNMLNGKGKFDINDWVVAQTAERFRQNKEEFQKYVENMRSMLNRNKAKANMVIANYFLAQKDQNTAKSYLQAALSAYLELIPDNMRHKSDNPDYYENLFNRAEIRRVMKNYDAASKDLIAASRRANSGSSKGPSVVGYYYKAQNELGKLYLEQGDTKKAHGAFMIVAALNFKKPDPADIPTVDQDASPRLKLEADAAKAGITALEETVYLSAKTASDLGDTATAQRMAKRYLENFPNGKFTGEAKRLAQ